MALFGLGRLRRWWLVALLGIGLAAIAMTYGGWASQDPLWNAPLDYPNRGHESAYQIEAFSSANVCAGCHPQQFAEWSRSGMGRSSQASLFLIDLYEAGLDLRGAPVEDVEQCLHCHAPLALMGDVPDFDLARQLSQEGVNCDVCHTAAAAHANDAPGMLVWDPTGPKRGSLPGRNEAGTSAQPPAISPHHDTVQSPLHQTSELCGACHMSLWPTNALPIDWTYPEWQRSPYAARGVTCQECHMPTYDGQAAVGGPARTGLRRHTFPGGGDVSFVKTAAEIEVEAHSHFAGHEVEVRVENVGAGHAFPTGNATAPVVRLEFRAFDSKGEEVFRGQREYRLVYVDGRGEITNDPTTAVAVHSDTTLQPLQPQHERFYLPHRLRATRVEARLVYQRWNDDIVANHGGLVREFVGRYMREGLRVHRVLARIADLDYDKLARVRAMDPVLVAEEAVVLPDPPQPPAGFERAETRSAAVEDARP